MPVRTRRLIQSILLAVALNATAASTYLPLVGPPALRFEPPRVEPLQNQLPLPSLPPLEPKVASPSPAVEATPRPPLLQPAPENNTGSLTNGLGQLAGSVPEAPIEQLPPPSPPAAEPMPGPHENLTPQMFMKFFTGRPGTNSAVSGTTIFAPLPFMPPVPITPASSSATYQTTLPTKP